MLSVGPANSYFLMVQERRSEDQCHYTESSRNQAVLTDLRRATQYEVQVRAHTAAGYGSFSPAAVFRTLPDGKKKHCVLLKSEECFTFLLFTEFFNSFPLGRFSDSFQHIQ